VELLCCDLGIEPGEMTFLTISYVGSLGLRKIEHHTIINPMETNCVAPLTDEVRYLTTEGLLDWLAIAEHPDAAEIRGALLWIYSYASRRAARMKLASSEAVIAQLETELADAIQARVRAQRSVSAMQRSVETKDCYIAFVSGQLDMEEELHAKTQAKLVGRRKKRKCAVVKPVCLKCKC
jgi:hypothetical protein